MNNFWRVVDVEDDARLAARACMCWDGGIWVWAVVRRWGYWRRGAGCNRFRDSRSEGNCSLQHDRCGADRYGRWFRPLSCDSPGAFHLYSDGDGEWFWNIQIPRGDGRGRFTHRPLAQALGR